MSACAPLEPKLHLESDCRQSAEGSASFLNGAWQRALPCRLEVVEVETFGLAFLVIGDSEFSAAFRAFALLLFQLTLGFLLRLFQALLLSCPFFLPLGGGRPSGHHGTSQNKLAL